MSHPRQTMARSLWICPRRPVRRQRQGDDQEDSRTGRQTEGGKGGGGGRFGMVTSPAGALAHLPCCHTKGDTIRVGLKDGGERGDVFFSPPTPWAARGKVWRMGGREGGNVKTT